MNPPPPCSRCGSGVVGELIRSFQPEDMRLPEYRALVLRGYQYPEPPVCAARWALHLPIRYDDILPFNVKSTSVRFTGDPDGCFRTVVEGGGGPGLTAKP